MVVECDIVEGYGIVIWDIGQHIDVYDEFEGNDFLYYKDRYDYYAPIFIPFGPVKTTSIYKGTASYNGAQELEFIGDDMHFPNGDDIFSLEMRIGYDNDLMDAVLILTEKHSDKIYAGTVRYKYYW